MSMPSARLALAFAALIGLAGAAVAARPTATAAAAQVMTRQQFVCALTLTIKTGGDDLRGGSDNLHAWIHAPFGTSHAETWLSLDDLLNAGAGGLNVRRNWPNWSTHSVRIPFPDCSLMVQDIKGIRLSTRATGGLSGDNWNMQAITLAWNGRQGDPVRGVIVSGTYLSLNEPRTTRYLFRFTGQSSIWEHDWAR